MRNIKIVEIEDVNFRRFLDYLKNHLAENGDNDMYFLPLSKDQSKFSVEWKRKFQQRLNKSVGEIGWRKLLVAVNQDDFIVGHIDIRSRDELNTGHRVLLGKGTDRKFRNMKIGQKLLNFVIEYCRNSSEISWLDLNVLAMNAAAIKLYEKMEFEVLGSTRDMFRIQNQSLDYNSMTLYVGSND